MFGRKKKKQTPALFGSRIEPDCAYCAFHADGVQKKCLAGQLGGENFNMTRCAASRKANKNSGNTAPRNSNYENLS
mgnify:CR=1 FL=1